MATTSEYMSKAAEYAGRPYRLEIEPDADEGGFVASYPDLPGCMTCGDTIEEAYRNAEDAKRCWIEAALEEGISVPEPATAKSYSGQFKLRIPKKLHKTLAEHSEREGVSMNQYCVYLLARNDALEQQRLSSAG